MEPRRPSLLLRPPTLPAHRRRHRRSRPRVAQERLQPRHRHGVRIARRRRHEGGVDEGEDPRIAAIRELREETGVTSAEIIGEMPYWLSYDFPPDVREKLNKQWGSDWKGQAQKWFLFRFTGKDEEINLSGDGTEKPEFAEWSWMTPQQVIELVVDFKKPVYEDVLKFFAPHLQSNSTDQE